jgi:hypothetical protein
VIYRNAREPSRPETRNRGGGNQSRKHHLRAFTRRKSSLTSPAPATLIYPKRNRQAVAADLPGSATSQRAPRHPITRELPARINPAFPCSIAGSGPSNPIFPSPAPAPANPPLPKAAEPPIRTPRWAGPRLRGGRRGNRCKRAYSSAFILYYNAVSQGARFESNLPIAGADQHAADGPVRDSAGGAGATDARELLVAILHSCAVSQGGGDFQADFMRLADPLLWCMRNCGKNAPGDTSRRYPHLRQFQGARRKRLAVDGETWLNALSPSSDFEYLVIPARNFQRPISIGGGMAMKQEMNEYSTFDRLYREIRAVRSGLRTAADCGSSCGRGAQPAQRRTSGSGSGSRSAPR